MGERPFTYCVLNQQGAPRYFTPRSTGGEDPGHLSGIKPVNLIVGPNNSGKSHLLRMLCKTIESRGGYGAGYPHLAALRQRPESNAVRSFVGTFPSVDRLRAELGDESIAEGEAFFSVHRLSQLTDEIRASPERWPGGWEGDWHTLLERLQKALPKGHREEWVRPDRKTFVPIYLSSFRTTRLPPFEQPPIRAQPQGATIAEKLGLLHGRLDTVGNDERSSFRARLETGELIAEQIRAHRLGDRTKREQLARFENFLGKQYFEGLSVDLIPRDDAASELHVRIGGEKERPFHQLGEGLQHILVMTWPMFMEQERDLVLVVEEPELCLHPGLQRRVLQSFTEAPLGASGSRTVFLATHSNHLIDAALEMLPDDVAVFQVRKRAPKGIAPGVDYDPQFEVRTTGRDDPEVLRALGVRPSSVLLANATIWVEGISDRLFLRRWLELHFAKTGTGFTEDIHFAFVEYGGGNRVHYDFWPATAAESSEGIRVDRISGDWFLVADGDGITESTAGEKADKVRELRAQEAAGKPVFVTKSREIENLVAAPILKKWMRKRWKVSGQGEPAFTQEDFSEACLGSFLQGLDWGDAGAIATESGTIREKARFAREINELTPDFESLSQEAKGLVERLGAFIEASNPR
jgi:energy-coupling factor transporter ATP-binding protein EcfA2